MHRGLFREPIHLNIANRGKLRKIQHQKAQLNQQHHDLLLTPHTILTDNKIQKKNYHQGYFKKQEERNKIFNTIPPIPNEQNTGSFRAIHTAHPNQSLRAFPLRSITAIKPFRRGIRSSHNYSKNTVQLSMGKEDVVRRGKRVELSATLNLQQLVTFQSPEYVYRYNENAQYQQFYKYRQKKPLQVEQNKRIAGTKIEPFKKYHIREINNHSYTQRIHNYQMIFNQ